MRDYKPDTVEVAKVKPLRSKKMKELRCYVLRKLAADDLYNAFQLEDSNITTHVTIPDLGEFVMIETSDEDECHLLLPIELVTITEQEKQ